MFESNLAGISQNKTNIVGTGATPEGVNQNPAYYEYVYDTAWVHNTTNPQDTSQNLSNWFATYSSRRYGNTGNADAEKAWALLLVAVYHEQGHFSSHDPWHDDSGVEWNGLGPCALPSMNLTAVHEAWSLLAAAGETLPPELYPTLNYDIVNTGREVLAQLIKKFAEDIYRAIGTVGVLPNKTAAISAAAVLMGIYADIDELTGCDYGFLLGPWIRDARAWANDTDGNTGDFLELQARAQVSTWWPVDKAAGAANSTNLEWRDPHSGLPLEDNCESLSPQPSVRSQFRHGARKAPFAGSVCRLALTLL